MIDFQPEAYETSKYYTIIFRQNNKKRKRKERGNKSFKYYDSFDGTRPLKSFMTQNVSTEKKIKRYSKQKTGLTM